MRSAGGAITDWEGWEFTIHSGHRRIVASVRPAPHGAVIGRLRLPPSNWIARSQARWASAMGKFVPDSLSWNVAVGS